MVHRDKQYVLEVAQCDQAGTNEGSGLEVKWSLELRTCNDSNLILPVLGGNVPQVVRLQVDDGVNSYFLHDFAGVHRESGPQCLVSSNQGRYCSIQCVQPERSPESQRNTYVIGVAASFQSVNKP